ncbi:MAG TPA: N-acetylmuramic acid 6-phosphate etherase [Candidatus Adamsella sp.]|nr:N-acetylmuramic acid 6-phosphate etherase [Candidatus Adamsella sp.]
MNILTEKRNKNTRNIDIENTSKILELIHKEDELAVAAVEKCLKNIEKAVDIIVTNFNSGGKLFYFGAGTSGRLGVLDASECPPTFGVSPLMVQGFIAGGDKALRYAIEGAEDSEQLAEEDFQKANPSPKDTICAISASGNAKYLLTILKLARNNHIKTISISSNKDALMKEYSDCFICAETGEEAITGSTRMKAGTAQKLILNMLTTASMIKIGKVYENLMIDVKPTNIKLKKRAVSIVSEIANVSEENAQKELEHNGYKVKHAILKLKYNLFFDDADKLLNDFNGVLRKVFNYLDNKNKI